MATDLNTAAEAKLKDLRLPGIEAPPGCDTPATRRAWLAALGDEELGAVLLGLADTLRQPCLLQAPAWSRFVGVPAGELVASPFGARASALGVARGVVATHHELRTPVRLRGELAPPGEVRDPTHGEWNRGVLGVGKYEDFRLDGALLTFNPTHSARWTAHEMVHRCVGYYWAESATPWTHYVGSRLAEMLPIVFWYGIDRVFRLDSEAFDRIDDSLRPDAAWPRVQWILTPEELPARTAAAVAALRSGVAQFDAELRAIRQEAQRFGRVEVEHPHVNTSSDARAYALAHRARLQSPALSWLHDDVLRGAAPLQDSIEGLANQVEATFDALLFGPIDIDPTKAVAARSGRLLWETLQRLVESAPSVAVELESQTEELAGALHSALVQGDGTTAGELLNQLDTSGLGLRTTELSERGIAQLQRGVGSIAPATAELLDAWPPSEQLWSRSPLPARVLRWLHPWRPDLAALLEFETALNTAPDPDPELAAFASPDPDLRVDSGWLVASRSFRVVAFSLDPVPLHAAWAEGEPLPAVSTPATYLIGTADEGQVGVLPCPPAVAALFERLCSAPEPVATALADFQDALARADLDPHWPQTAEDWLLDLLEAGAVGLVEAKESAGG